MSGVAGGNRIQKSDVSKTFNSFVNTVLKEVKGFKQASLSGSVKAGNKDDYGDLDIIAYFEGTDKRQVKQSILVVTNSLPDNIILPFRSSRYKGRKYYNSGEIITVLYPIQGKKNEAIQVDIIIALSEKEEAFKEGFLDLPAEKQGLLLGLAKVILLEENTKDALKRIGINTKFIVDKDEELEFNLSSSKLCLRKVKLQEFKELERQELWSTTDWNLVKELFKNYNIDGTFEELLEDIKRKTVHQRSKNRIKGLFKSMVSVKSGEVGTPKGESKERAIQAVNTLVEQDRKTIALYAGGFKPPHKGHFNNALYLSKKAQKLIIYIGPKFREGIPVSPEQSKEIWETYARFLPIPVEVHISKITPVKDIYDYVDSNQDIYNKIITGAMPDEMSKFAHFNKNKEKYPNVEVLTFPVLRDRDEKLSASTIRTQASFLRSGKWIPPQLSVNDKKSVIDIIMASITAEAEAKMHKALEEALLQAFPEENLKVKEHEIVEEGASGTPIGPRPPLSAVDKDKLAKVYEKLVQVLGRDDEFEIDFSGDRIVIKLQNYDDKGYDYTPFMSSLLEHMIDLGMKVVPLPEIKTRRDMVESADFFGKTAHYDPNDKVVTLYVEGRHPKDVMRSFSHEMIHHMQNLEGRLGDISTQNTNEDTGLQKIEEEAYLKGNMVFRTWEDKVKS